MPILLGGLLWFGAGCESMNQRDNLFAKRAKKAKAAATEGTEEDMSQLELGAPLKAFRINPDYGWVVVRSAKALIPGEHFSAWHGDEETAKLVVDERSRHPYYILEVTAGDPHPNDTYTPARDASSIPDQWSGQEEDAVIDAENVFDAPVPGVRVISEPPADVDPTGSNALPQPPGLPPANELGPPPANTPGPPALNGPASNEPASNEPWNNQDVGVQVIRE